MCCQKKKKKRNRKKFFKKMNGQNGKRQRRERSHHDAEPIVPMEEVEAGDDPLLSKRAHRFASNFLKKLSDEDRETFWKLRVEALGSVRRTKKSTREAEEKKKEKEKSTGILVAEKRKEKRQRSHSILQEGSGEGSSSLPPDNVESVAEKCRGRRKGTNGVFSHNDEFWND